MAPDTRADAALRELQHFVAGPALDDLLNEAVLRLDGASADFVEQELGTLAEQLGNLLSPGTGELSPTLATGHVIATITAIRTLLATSPACGTA